MLWEPVCIQTRANGWRSRLGTTRPQQTRGQRRGLQFLAHEGKPKTHLETMPARALLRLRDMREEPQVEVLGDGPAPGVVIRHLVWLLMYRFGAAVVSTVTGATRLVDSFLRKSCPPCPSKVPYIQGPAFHGVAAMRKHCQEPAPLVH